MRKHSGARKKLLLLYNHSDGGCEARKRNRRENAPKTHVKRDWQVSRKMTSADVSCRFGTVA